MNQSVIEILTEELSMAIFLEQFLPFILPHDYRVNENCFVRPHEGKSDLQKSIPKKMKQYPHFGYPVKVLIIHDQDSNDCVELKNALLELAATTTNIPLVVRIACRELENWYLGDLKAVEALYPETRATSFIGKAKFRTPDNLGGAFELEKMTKRFSKTQAARDIPKLMNIEANTSYSFQQFRIGLHKLLSM